MASKQALLCSHRLLYGDMLESSCSEITLGDTPPEAFSIILEYMYSGKVAKVDLQVCTMQACVPTGAYEGKEHISTTYQKIK